MKAFTQKILGVLAILALLAPVFATAQYVYPIPPMSGQAGKFLQAASNELDLQWGTAGGGGGGVTSFNTLTGAITISEGSGIDFTTLGNNIEIATALTGGTNVSVSGGATRSITVPTPGANTQVIYNDNGVFSAESGLTFEEVDNVLTVDGITMYSPDTDSIIIGGPSTVSSAGLRSLILGFDSGQGVLTDNNIFLGFNVGEGATGVGSAGYNIGIGTDITYTSNTQYSFAIGHGIEVEGDGVMVIGNVWPHPLQDVYFGQGEFATVGQQRVTLHGSGVRTLVDTMGTSLGLAAGVGTGIAQGADLFFQTPVPDTAGSGGTTQLLGDRYVIRGQYVPLLDNIPTQIALVGLDGGVGSGSAAIGGTINVTFWATDGVDEQVHQQYFTYEALFDGVAVQHNLYYVNSIQPALVTSGTLTCTVSLQDAGQALEVVADCISDLGQDLVVANVQMTKNFGVGVISR